jgi:hypothetical protein
MEELDTGTIRSNQIAIVGPAFLKSNYYLLELREKA